MMDIVIFSSGFIVGSFILYVYFKYKIRVYKEKFDHEKKTYQLVESSKDIIYHYEVKPNFRFRYISPSIEPILGEGLIEKSYENPYYCFEHIHPDDYPILYNKIHGAIDFSKALIQRWRNQEGEYIWFEEYVTPIYENDKLVAIKGVMRNITEQIMLQKELEYQLTHDYLTGVYNRRYYAEKFDLFNNYENSAISIIICDLDELKQTNDQFGHKIGDQLIMSTAEILNSFSKEDVIVSRLGGDEFAVIIIGKLVNPVQLMEEIIVKIEEFNQTSNEIDIKVSMGLASTNQSIGNMDDLFIKADKNMYKNKNLKKVTL